MVHTPVLWNCEVILVTSDDIQQVLCHSSYTELLLKLVPIHRVCSVLHLTTVLDRYAKKEAWLMLLTSRCCSQLHFVSETCKQCISQSYGSYSDDQSQSFPGDGNQSENSFNEWKSTCYYYTFAVCLFSLLFITGIWCHVKFDKHEIGCCDRQVIESCIMFKSKQYLSEIFTQGWCYEMWGSHLMIS